MYVLKRFNIDSTNPTFGVFLRDGKPLCVTMERPWVNNIKSISCIPAGEYQCVKYSGTKWKDVWELIGVPNRSAILIHAANRVDQIEGCIAVGRAFSGDQITNSQDALNILRKELPTHFLLEIINP